MAPSKIIVIIATFCLLACGCSVMEMSIDDMVERPLPRTPVIAYSLDSSQVFKAKSTIQCSAEYLLSAYVVVKDGEYTLDIPQDERKELGISEKDYKAYLKTLMKTKPCKGL